MFITSTYAGDIANTAGGGLIELSICGPVRPGPWTWPELGGF